MLAAESQLYSMLSWSPLVLAAWDCLCGLLPHLETCWTNAHVLVGNEASWLQDFPVHLSSLCLLLHLISLSTALSIIAVCALFLIISGRESHGSRDTCQFHSSLYPIPGIGPGTWDIEWKTKGANEWMNGGGCSFYIQNSIWRWDELWS